MVKPSTVVARYLLTAKDLPRRGRQYDGSFHGKNDGSWWIGSTGGRADWSADLSMALKNDYRNIDVDGATEHNTGFRSALNEIVKEYPELLNFVIKFDGPWMPVSTLVHAPAPSNQPNWSTMTFYHGTSEWAAERILREGLRPRAATNVNPAYGVSSSATSGRADAIYLTTQLQMAHFAAVDAAKTQKSTPVILEVRGVDEDHVAADEDSRETDAAKSLARIGSIAYLAPIPASKVKLYERSLGHGNWEKVAARVALRFAMIHPTPEALAKYLHEHPDADRASHSVKKRTRKNPKPESETSDAAKARPESAPAAKGETLSTPVKPTRNGAGQGLGKVILHGSSSETSAKFDAVVAKTDHPKKLDQVGRIMEAVGIPKPHIAKAKKWARDWLVGTADASSPGKNTISQKHVEEYLDALAQPDSWARAQYEATQAKIRAEMADLKARKIIDDDGNVTLYRGIRGAQAETLRKEYPNAKKTHPVKTQVRGLSSWTETPDMAAYFAHGDPKSVMQVKVHYTRIATMYQGQADMWHRAFEREWVVLGNEAGDMDCTLHSGKTLEKVNYERPTKY